MATSFQRMVLSAVTAVLVALTVSAASAKAQSLWMPRDHSYALFLEALHPSIEGSDPDALTGALYLGARARIGSDVSIVTEVPYARFRGAAYEFYGIAYNVDHATFGNPYFGFEFQREGSIFFVELGARAPFAEREEWAAINAGLDSDFGRFDAFTPDVVPIHLIANIRELTPSGLMLRFRLGPMMVYSTEYHLRDFYALFAWQFGYEGKAIRAGTAITGTTLLNDTDNLGARTSTSFEAHVDFGSWKVRPGLELKMPIGPDAAVIPLVLGLSVGASW